MLPIGHAVETELSLSLRVEASQVVAPLAFNGLTNCCIDLMHFTLEIEEVTSQKGVVFGQAV